MKPADREIKAGLNLSGLVEAASSWIFESIENVMEKKDVFSLALSGSTMHGSLYKHLARRHCWRVPNQ